MEIRSRKSHTTTKSKTSKRQQRLEASFTANGSPSFGINYLNYIYNQKISDNLITSKEKLYKLHGEIEQMLEKITSREKYINGQFEGQV